MRNTSKKRFTAKYLKNGLTSFNDILSIFISFKFPHFYVQSHSTKLAWGQGSRNPLKGLQFVSLDTRERLRYSEVNLP